MNEIRKNLNYYYYLEIIIITSNVYISIGNPDSLAMMPEALSRKLTSKNAGFIS